MGDFRLLDRRCVAALRLMRENQRFTKGLFTWIGFRKKELSFHVQPRAAGKTTWNYFALYNLAVEGLTSFTTAPLRMTTFLGLAVSLLAISYMFVVLINALLYGDPVAGYPTLMTVMLFLDGEQATPDLSRCRSRWQKNLVYAVRSSGETDREFLGGRESLG